MQTTPKKAIVFPGQGAQKTGMAKDFYDDSDEVKQTFAHASDVLGFDLKSLCFEQNDRLNLTAYTQPAILTVEIAILRCIKAEYDISFDYYGGHSLGEYTALVAAGAMDFSDALKIVHKRGTLMQHAVPEGRGAMIAVIMTNILDEPVAEMIEETGAEISNYNSTNQIVVSGIKKNVEEASDRLKETWKKIKVIPLKVSAPFHSSLMAAIESPFSEYLSQFKANMEPARAASVVSNYTGAFHDPDRLLDHLTKQISGSVQWIRNMKLLAQHADEIIEVGPNQPLSAFFRTIDIRVQGIVSVTSMRKHLSAE